MALAASPLLDPHTLASIRDLELVARTVVDGLASGRQLSPRPGHGAEFVQYRAYQPGDDPRRVDWRMYARSDRYFVREAVEDRDVTVRFVLDATASMAHPWLADGAADAPAKIKLDYARLLVASLAYLVDAQGERVELTLVGPEDDRRRHDQRPLQGVLERLTQAKPTGVWPPWTELEPRLRSRRRRELVVLVSDLHDRDDHLYAAIEALRERHEVLCLQLLGRDELELPWDGDVELEDLETGRVVRLDGGAARARYGTRLRDHLDDWRLRLLDLAVPYEMIVTDEPLDRALRRYLSERQRRG